MPNFEVLAQTPFGVLTQTPFGILAKTPLGILAPTPFGVLTKPPFGVLAKKHFWGFDQNPFVQTKNPDRQIGKKLETDKALRHVGPHWPSPGRRSKRTMHLETSFAWSADMFRTQSDKAYIPETCPSREALKMFLAFKNYFLSRSEVIFVFCISSETSFSL